MEVLASHECHLMGWCFKGARMHATRKCILWADEFSACSSNALQVQNAEGLYRRAGKQRRAVEKVQPLLEAADAEVYRANAHLS